MAKAEVSITNTNSIIEEIMRRQDMIARRAFELFQGHMNSFNAELDDWLMAEREVSMPPDIHLRRADGRFEIDAALPDIDPKKLDVKVTPEDVLITAERGLAEAEVKAAEGKAPAEGAKPAEGMKAEGMKAEGMKAEGMKAEGMKAEGMMRYFSAIHLPEPIDPGGVEAHFKKGVLHLTAKIAKGEPKNIEVRM